MKVGDLVKFKGSDLVVGILIDLRLTYDADPHRRVGIMWTDGNGVGYEPLDWLERVNEGG